MATPCSALPGQSAFRKFWTYKRNACVPSVGRCGDDCAKPGFQLNPFASNVTGSVTIDTADRARSIATFILMTRSAQDSERCGGRPTRYGGYWADSFRSDKLNSGSRIYYVSRNASVNDTVSLIVAYAIDDLQKMVKMGEAEAVSVTGKYGGNGIVRLNVVITVDGENIDVPFAATRGTGSQWVIFA